MLNSVPMRKLFQIIVLSLLIVGIPLQGFASTTMLLCNETQSAATHADTARYHQHDETVAGQHDHDGASSHSQGSHDPDSKCSVCAACCIGAGIAAAVFQLLPSRAPSAGIIAFNSAHFYRITPERLVRPPVSPLI